jgi:hypothetical protein
MLSFTKAEMLEYLDAFCETPPPLVVDGADNAVFSFGLDPTRGQMPLHISGYMVDGEYQSIATKITPVQEPMISLVPVVPDNA